MVILQVTEKQAYCSDPNLGMFPERPPQWHIPPMQGENPTPPRRGDVAGARGPEGNKPRGPCSTASTDTGADTAVCLGENGSRINKRTWKRYKRRLHSQSHVNKRQGKAFKSMICEFLVLVILKVRASHPQKGERDGVPEALCAAADADSAVWQEWHSYVCVGANHSSLLRTLFCPFPFREPPHPHPQSPAMISISKQYLVPLNIFSLVSYPHSVSLQF